VARRHSPSDGLCSLGGDPEDRHHIFFACVPARMMWAGVREHLHCVWNLAGARDFIVLAHGLLGSLRRLVWFTFAAQCLTLWNMRNKLIIQGKMIMNPTDFFYQMSVHMQCRSVLVKSRDRTLLNKAMSRVRRLHARTKA
jgi:hypothetical protein